MRVWHAVLLLVAVVATTSWLHWSHERAREVTAYRLGRTSGLCEALEGASTGVLIGTAADNSPELGRALATCAEFNKTFHDPR